MKQYQLLKLVIHVLPENDVVTTSDGTYEGVSDLNPTDRSDWFQA